MKAVSRVFYWFFTILYVLPTSPISADDKSPHFETDVRPIFKAMCFHCHGGPWGPPVDRVVLTYEAQSFRLVEAIRSLVASRSAWAEADETACDSRATLPCVNEINRFAFCKAIAPLNCSAGISMKSIYIPNAQRIASRLGNEKLKLLLPRIRIRIALETPLRRARSVTELSSSRTRFYSLTSSTLAGSWTTLTGDNEIESLLLRSIFTSS